MLRTVLGKEYLRRTLRPLYAFEHATPTDRLLDPLWNRSVPIWPGMCMMLKAVASTGTSDVVTLLDATGTPYGLCDLYIGGDGIDEPLNAGINAVPVWVIPPGSEFEVLSPAFDNAAAWTFPITGLPLYVSAYTGASASSQGVLCPLGAVGSHAKPIARVVSRPDTNRLIITGITMTEAYG